MAAMALDIVHIQERTKGEWVEIAVSESFIRKANLSLLIIQKWIPCYYLAAREAGNQGTGLS